MAGLLDRITRQVLNKQRPKTMSQTANRPPVMVMPVKHAAKPVAPIVGPEPSVPVQEVAVPEEITNIF